MQSLLSRIEREYVLKSLEDDLPGLTLQHGPCFEIVGERSYRVSGGIIEFSGSQCSLPGSASIGVYFKHKKREMYFASTLRKDAGKYLLPLPENLYKFDGDERADSGCRMTLPLSGAIFELPDSADFPLDVVFVDPDLKSTKQAAMVKLVVRIGLDAKAYGSSLLAFRLLEFIERFRDASFALSAQPVLLYIDSSLALVSIPAAAARTVGCDDPLPAVIRCVNRKIECLSRVVGKIPVNNETLVLCLDISASQLEDKRFLHERLFRSKYT